MQAEDCVFGGVLKKLKLNPSWLTKTAVPPKIKTLSLCKFVLKQEGLFTHRCDTNLKISIFHSA